MTLYNQVRPEFRRHGAEVLGISVDSAWCHQAFAKHSNIHFPLLAEELGQALPGVRFIDGGAGIARRVAWLTRDQPWPAEPSAGIMIFTATGRTLPLSTLAARLWNRS